MDFLSNHILLQTYSKVLANFYSKLNKSSQKELFGWGSVHSQTERFRVILEEAKLHFDLSSDDMLLDMGCGHADLFKYMKEHDYVAKYTGADFFPDFIHECKKRYPAQRFIHHNILKPVFIGLGSFDIVCMSGVLNLNVEPYISSELKDANFKVLLIVLKRLMSVANKGLLVNFLHEREKNKDNFFAYYNPERLVEKLEKEGFSIVNMRDDYLENDFTLVIEKKSRSLESKTEERETELAQKVETKNTSNLSSCSIFTDGGCRGNPGIGAWGFWCEELDISMNGNSRETTNNRMELSAAIEALKWARSVNFKKINIYTDSRYVQQGISQWIKSWKLKAWRTASGSAVKNKDLWEELDVLVSNMNVVWHWVEGHAGQEGNERAHQLVTESMDLLKK